MIFSSQDTGLLSLYEQFAVAVSQYQVLWDELGNIDRNTWVLEPEKPAYNATYRRIALGKDTFTPTSRNGKAKAELAVDLCVSQKGINNATWGVLVLLNVRRFLHEGVQTFHFSFQLYIDFSCGR